MQQERRKNQDRRTNDDRRSVMERRTDHRQNSNGQRKSILIWLRSVTKARLGVDRRKEDRREPADRRQLHIGTILSQEEIADLLSM